MKKLEKIHTIYKEIIFSTKESLTIVRKLQKKECIYLAKYVTKRVLLAIVTVFIVCGITFFSMNAIPGGPFDGEKALSPEVKEALEKRFNLDKSVPEQFVLYLKNLAHGDFGVSAKTGRDIKTTIFESFKVSAKLGGMAIITALILGLIFGSIAALTRNKLPDRLIIFLSTLFTSLPSFVFASLLLLVFCVTLKWIPVWSPSNPNYLLPVIALSAYPMAYITRLTKTSMLDVMGQDYVRTARAKGVAKLKVIFKHTLRNALIPVVKPCCRKDFYYRRSWCKICGRYHKQRLSYDHGNNNFPGCSDGNYESYYRYCL